MAKDPHDLREEATGRVAEALAAHVGDPTNAAAEIQRILDEYNPPDDGDPTIARLRAYDTVDGKLRFEEPASGDYADLNTHSDGHWWFEGESDVVKYSDDIHETVAAGVLRLVPWGNEDDNAMMIAYAAGAAEADD